MSFTSAPEFLDDFMAKSTDILENDIGLSPEQALSAAEKLVKFIKKDWSGQQIYFPKCAEDELSARDLQLWEQFNGNNYSQVAREFNVSVQWVYKVVKFMRAKNIANKQIDAFPDESLQSTVSRRHA